MKISIDTKEDSHEEIRKVIKMLQNLVGEGQEIFSNEPDSSASSQSPIANIFGDASSVSSPSVDLSASETTQSLTETQETSGSTEDLFAELFSEEELKKMDTVKKEEDEDEEEETEAKSKSKSKKAEIEFY